jgi:hypothetical protein
VLLKARQQGLLEDPALRARLRADPEFGPVRDHADFKAVRPPLF